MKCPKCKKRLRKNAKFCPACGARVKRRWSVPKLLIVAILLVIVALGWGLGILVAKRFNRSNKTLFSGKDTIIIHNVEDAIAHAKKNGEEYGYDNALSELTAQVTTTIGGDSYYRLQQNYQGIPVYGRSVVYNTDENGDLEYISGNALVITVGFETTPTITFFDIEQSVGNYVREQLGINLAKKYDFAVLPENALCIYAPESTKATLAYRVNACGYEFVVDAHTGNVLFYDSYIRTGYAKGNLHGEIKTYENVTYLEDAGVYQLNDTARKITAYQAKNEETFQFWGFQTINVNYNNVSELVEWHIGENPLPAAVDAYANAQIVYDYFDIQLGNKAADGAGEAELILLTGIEYRKNEDGSLDDGMMDNASSSVDKMADAVLITFGIGTDDSPAKSAYVDWVAHEYTHAVEKYHSNMIYQGEAGSITEGLCDIFGELAESWASRKNPNWVFSGEARNMRDPHSGGYPAKVTDANNSIEDDVHAYSTVISHAAYLMWNGIDGNTAKRISNDELAELWYRAMLMMPSNCNFVECRKLVERAADSMETLTNEQRLCISEAFDIVGIVSRENTMTAEYHLTKNSALNVFDEDGNLYAGYTLRIIGELIDNEPTVNIPGALRNTRYEKEYQIEDSESFELNLPGGLYTLTVTDKYSSAIYSVTAYVSNEGTDDSIEIYTSYEEPLVVVIPIESTNITEPPIEEKCPPEQNEQPKTLKRINRYDENGTLKQETIFNYSANGVLINAVDRELDQAESVVHEAVIPFTFNEKGRLTEIGTADSNYYSYPTAGYIYNSDDQLIGSYLADGGGSDTTYEYDNQGRLARKFEDDASAPITVETFFYYDDSNKNEIRAKEITTSSWEAERPTVEEKTYVYSLDGNGHVVTICGESDITTYRYEYWPIVIEEHCNTDTGYVYQNLNYVDSQRHTIWYFRQGGAIGGEQTFDDRSLKKLNLSTNSGTVTYEFIYDNSESAETNSKILNYPISEEDCYVIYKNYYGCEMESDEYQVQVDRHGSGTKETLIFNIYRLNEISGGFTWTNAFSVYVNTGICSLEFSDEFFQADDYFY